MRFDKGILWHIVAVACYGIPLRQLLCVVPLHSKGGAQQGPFDSIIHYLAHKGKENECKLALCTVRVCRSLCFCTETHEDFCLKCLIFVPQGKKHPNSAPHPRPKTTPFRGVNGDIFPVCNKLAAPPQKSDVKTCFIERVYGTF